MAGSINRRGFLGRAGTAAAAVMGAPFIRPSRATAATGDRLVVAVGQWGTETPFAWRTVQAEKPLWDCILLGMKSITWAMSRKVGGWQPLAYVPMETNYEYVSPAS